jgi:hypothetical protein
MKPISLSRRATEGRSSLPATFSAKDVSIALTFSGAPQGVPEREDLATSLSARGLLARRNTGVFNNVRASSSFVSGHHTDEITFARRAIAESARLSGRPAACHQLRPARQN